MIVQPQPLDVLIVRTLYALELQNMMHVGHTDCIHNLVLASTIDLREQN